MSESNYIDELINRSDYSGAEKRLKEMLTTSPECEDLKVTLARMLMLQDKYCEAKEILSGICTLDAAPFEVLWLLGIACEHEKQFDEAIEILERALKHNVRTSLVHYELGRIHNNYEYKDRDRHAARRHLRFATTGEDVVPEAFIDRLLIESPERGNYLLRSGLKRFPGHERMNEILCWRLYHSSDFNGCLKTIATAREAGVETNELSLIDAFAQLRLSKFNQALQSLDKVQPHNDRSRSGLNTLRAICLLESGNYVLAQQCLDEVMNDDFNNDLEFAAHFISICCYMRQQLTSQAETVMAEIPISSRFDSPLWIWIDGGELDFESYFSEALDLVASAPASVEAVAKAKAFRGMYSCRQDLREADSTTLKNIREDLTQGLEQWGLDPELNSCLSSVLRLSRDWVAAAHHHWLGQLHLLEDKEYYPALDKNILEAIYANRSLTSELLAEITNIVSDDTYYYSSKFAKHCLAELIEFFHQKQAFDLVAQLAEKFSYEHLRSADSVFEAAYAYAEVGRKKEARSLYKRYLQDAGPNSAVANNLGILEEEFGNLLEAQRLLEDALKQDSANDKARGNLERVRTTISKLEAQKRAVERAADLFVHEPHAMQVALARLYAKKTKDNLIFCDSRKTAELFGVRSDKAHQKISEVISKKYFDEVLDPGIVFDGKLLRPNPGLVPYLEDALRAADEAERISQISSDLSAEVLSDKYGYNKELLEKLAFVESPELGDMLRRDLQEAVTSLITQSYKSSLVLCGSIAEAMLLDQLITRRQEAQNALQELLGISGSTLKSEDRKIDRWSLDRLLDVCLKLGLVSKNLYHWGHGIRDFRNLVHPAAEQRKTIEVSRENANTAWNVVKRLIRELHDRAEKQLQTSNRQ